MAGNLFHGLTALGNGPAVGYLFLGALVGVFIGVIPGLGGAVVLSIILIFIYHIDLTGTLCLFLGTQAGGYYAASVTSILLNTPAHPEAFPVTFDGFPMAQRGQPARALGISACSTCIGGFIGCAVLLGFLQILDRLPGLFHPPEYVALVTLAMLMVGTLGADSVAKSLIAAGAGLMIASIGPSVVTGTFRYTFNTVGLSGGISLVALALGVFAVPQMVMIFGTGTTFTHQDMTGKEIAPSQAVDLKKGFGKQLIGGVFETFHHWRVLILGGLIGSLTGIVPGIGGFAANFLSYGIAKQTSKKRELFGTGIAEGIIAPESSSLSKEAGSMIPILGLGIPGSVGGALFIAALTIKDIRTGYGFTAAYPTVGYEIVWIIALAGLIGTVAGVLLGPQLAKVTRVPGPLIVPFILALSIIGPFLADGSFFAVVEVLAFGLIGLGLRRLQYPLASFILGLVLGPTFETNIYLTRNVYPGLTFITRRPLADVIFLTAMVLLVAKAFQFRRENKVEKAAASAAVNASDDVLIQAELIREQHRKQSPYPLLAPTMTLLLLIASLYFVFFGATHYGATTLTMPLIGSIMVAGPAFYLFPKDLYRYVLYRKAKVLAKHFAASPDGTLPERTSASAFSESASEQVQHLSAADLFKALGPPPIMSQDGSPIIHDKAWGRHGQYTREAIALAWFTALIAACWFFGFSWGVPAFMATYGLACTRRYLRTRLRWLSFTVLSTALMWGVVQETFNIVHLLFTPKIHL